MNNTQTTQDFSEMDDLTIGQVKRPKTDAELDAEMLELFGDDEDQE